MTEDLGLKPKTEVKVSLVVAISTNGVIGKGGKLPWEMPADLAFFRKVTLNHPVIMGRRTWEAFPGVLGKRENIVLTRQSHYQAEGATVAASLERALGRVKAPRVMVIGGVPVFESALPIADTVWVTEVHGEVEGDTFFHFDRKGWEEVSRIDHPRDKLNPYPYSFVRWSRLPMSSLQ